MAGVPVTLTVTLQVKQEGAQYVMLEVPVPAGCSYASKPVNFSRSEVYREYFKEKTVIFSEKLPVGTLSVYGSFASTLYWKIYAEPCESGTDVFPGGECK